VNRYNQSSQERDLGLFLLYKKNSSAKLFLVFWIFLFCIAAAGDTKGISLIFLVLFLIFLRLHKSKINYDRILFTPSVIKLFSENDSSNNVFYTVPKISLINIRLKKVYRWGLTLYVDLELINGKIKTISFEHFVSFTDSLTGFQANRIYKFCKENYKIPIVRDY